MNEFTTLAYLLSFPGMIIAVVTLTQFTKKMFDKIKNNRTKYVVYGYSLILCIVGAIVSGGSIMHLIVLWGMNSVIVWFAAMKSFEIVLEKPKTTGSVK